MLYRVDKFYIEAESERDAFLKYVNIRYDIYFSREDKVCHDSFLENWDNIIYLDEKIIKVSDKTADEYFHQLLERVHERCPGSYFNYSDQGTYDYDGILILTEDGDENAVTVAAYHEGNGVYSVGPGLTGIGYLRLNRVNNCEKFDEFLKTVSEFYDKAYKCCTRFKENAIQL